MKAVLTLVVGAALVALPSADAALPSRTGKLAFVRANDVWVVNSDGQGLRRVTHGSFRAPASEPAWSADGKRIAYSRACTLYVVNANGHKNRRLVRRPRSSRCDADPSWSPDGRRIVFARTLGKTIEDIYARVLVVLDLRTGRIKRLTQRTRIVAQDSAPAWAPRGGLIAFQRADEEGDYHVVVVRSNGSGLHVLARRDGSLSDLEPAWTPNGKRVLFARLRHRDTYYLYSAAANGSAQRDLTPDAKPVGFRHPTVSPDGRWVAFVASGLGVVGMNGQGTRMLSHDPNDASPDWQRPRR